MIEHGLSFSDVERLLRYDEASGLLFWRVSRGGVFAGTIAGSTSSRGYSFIRINKRAIMTANIVFLLHAGRWPKGILDHQDGDKLNNHFSNLRETDQAGNCRNMGRSIRNKSGVTGVVWHHKAAKWMASIFINERSVYLGLFEDIDSARLARLKAQADAGFHANHGGAR